MVNKGLITIPSATTHKLFKLGECGRDAFLLYGFLQYTALWQNEKFGINNRPKATREYCKKGLHWSTDRFQAANKILVDLDLITKRITRDKKGHVTGHFVELPFVNHMSSPKDVWPENPPVLQNHPMAVEPTNTDTKDIKNTDSKVIPTASDNKGDFFKKNTKEAASKGETGPAQQPISNLSKLNDITAYLSGPWKELDNAESETVQDLIYKNSSEFIRVQPHIVKNIARTDFNNHLEAKLADGKPVPETRRAYILRLANYIRVGEQWKIAEANNRMTRQSQTYVNPGWNFNWDDGDE